MAKPNAEPSIAEMIDGLILGMECVPERASMEEAFDYADVLDDEEFEDPLEPRYYM